MPLRRDALERRADLLDEFDANVSTLEKLIAESDEETLGEEWTLRNGNHIIRREPRAIALRTFELSHMVHLFFFSFIIFTKVPLKASSSIFTSFCFYLIGATASINSQLLNGNIYGFSRFGGAFDYTTSLR